MPEKQTIEAAKKDKREGKAASTQAGEFVREEMHHIRGGKHGATSAKQAIAIGLSKARRSGVKLAPPRKGAASEQTRRKAERDVEKGQSGDRRVSRRRSRAVEGALKKKGRTAASHQALSSQARSAARKRGAADRSRAARKAVKTKGKAVLHRAGVKAAHTRMMHEHASHA